MKNRRVFHGEQFFQKSLFPFHMDRFVIEKTVNVATHTHDFFELVYVLQGDAVHQIEEQIYQLEPGNVFFLEPDVSHQYSASHRQNTVVYNVLFSKEFIHEELSLLNSRPYLNNFFYLIPFLRKSSANAPYLPLVSAQQQQIKHQLDTIYEEYQTQEDGFQIIIKTRMIETLILLSRYYAEAQWQQTARWSDEQVIDSISLFLKEHRNQPVSLVQLSQIFGMSVSSLTAKFKQHTGRTLIDYKHSLQIEQACSTLRGNQDKKISAVALDCGFNDLSHFNRVFKKHTGTTPKKYRSN
ncbi:AraC family transcriptional regulator [Sediminibacillus massiliensis]|uniref:AraC family transcriptional regulator n=1 Tax=Sediminibacillus massiliensis TaxID=1926277 RepID=UPI0015C31F01|nr:AraC family transcriptional regulator [Sediminibacillus massiliensis]